MILYNKNKGKVGRDIAGVSVWSRLSTGAPAGNRQWDCGALMGNLWSVEVSKGFHHAALLSQMTPRFGFSGTRPAAGIPVSCRAIAQKPALFQASWSHSAPASFTSCGSHGSSHQFSVENS